MYCLWPLPCVLFMCTTLVHVLFVATPMCTISVYYFSICTLLEYVYCLWPLPCLPYFTLYFYKIVGVAVLAFAYCSSYHCYSFYKWLSLLLLQFKRLQIVPHLLLVCTTLVPFVCTTLVVFVCTTLVLFVCTSVQ